MTRLRGGIRHWVDGGRLVSLDGDVLGVVNQVKAISPRLNIYYDDWDDGFTIAETSLDGSTESLVFRVSELDQRVVDRLLASDHWRGREDPAHVLPEAEDYATRVDKFNEELQKEYDQQDMEARHDSIERLAWALEKDGKGMKAQIHVKEGL
jgi:hypothetical protein